MPESISQASKKPSILLVEDYAPNILVATLFLEQFGYTCDVAKNGREALEMIEHSRENYIVVLMDVQMHELNGFETTKIIREQEDAKSLARLPIIGMTAHALAGDRERCIEAGMDDYISKPFDPMELKEKLASYSKKYEALFQKKEKDNLLNITN
ncbi:MAG: response regulator [Pseudomonadota bacterium]